MEVNHRFPRTQRQDGFILLTGHPIVTCHNEHLCWKITCCGQFRLPMPNPPVARKLPGCLTPAMNPFRAPSRLDGAWHKVGLASAFPDLDIDYDGRRITAKCKAFRIPNSKTNGPQQPECPIEADIDLPGDLKDQVLVFKYKGRFHAIDHQCPHSSFPLSQGSLFDIEDFGVVLSAGITCPKHGWSFDLFSGQSDRGNYKLKVWEVQLRDLPGLSDGTSEATDKEVWVRRKQRIG